MKFKLELITNPVVSGKGWVGRVLDFMRLMLNSTQVEVEVEVEVEFGK